MVNILSIRSLAKKHNWVELFHKENEKRLRFEKGIDRKIIDVWYSKMTIGTTVNHPEQGRTTLFRKRVDERTLEDIFRNPRIHTKFGYKKKKNV